MSVLISFPGQFFCQSSPWYLFVLTVVAAQLLSCVQLCDPRTVACQDSLSSTITLSLLKFIFIVPVVLSNCLSLCHPILLPSVFPSIRVFSNEPTAAAAAKSLQSYPTLCDPIDGSPPGPAVHSTNVMTLCRFILANAQGFVQI